MNKIELQNLVGGALQEKFEKAFAKVIENLQDSNTSFKVKRGITIKLTFDQNEERDDVSVSIDVSLLICKSLSYILFFMFNAFLSLINN